MTDSRTALVTGATGFIGRHLVRRLLDQGWNVRGLVRGHPHPRWLHEGVDTVVGDLTRPSSLSGSASGCDVVFHTACATAATFAAGRDAEMLFMRVNRDGTEAMAREAAAAGARFVHLSSTAAMGVSSGAGARLVDEESVPAPISPYGRSKLQAERSLEKLARITDLDYVILRPCMTAGPGKRGGEVRKLVKLAGLGLIPVVRGTEDAIKPIVFVEDVVTVMLQAWAKGGSGRVYLIHDGGDHTLMEIVAAAGRVAGRKRPHVLLPEAPLRSLARGFDAVHARLPRFEPPLTTGRLEMLETSRRISIERARRDLGYDPEWTDVEEMLRLSV
jgi:nucleoside-diphosphate-sugar epimerase